MDTLSIPILSSGHRQILKAFDTEQGASATRERLEARWNDTI